MFFFYSKLITVKCQVFNEKKIKRIFYKFQYIFFNSSKRDKTLVAVLRLSVKSAAINLLRITTGKK